MTSPNPQQIHPLKSGLKSVTYIQPTITRPNVIVGEFSYFAGENFEAQVTHHYDFIGDKLIIGKFCQIGAGVEFVMNGVSTFPFYIFAGFPQTPPPVNELPIKGDTVVGNDVWIGQNTVILPGVHIGDGAIIGANSVVGSDIPPYTIALGNPTRLLRKRFDDELIDLLLQLKWWHKDIKQIQTLIPILSETDREKIKKEIKKLI